ncbi:MAG: DUF2207 domain-containing protein [Erysipelotrichia bacterium]|nr:DUF2207 domain-containing protein [Erysipelotrichia bacterium]
MRKIRKLLLLFSIMVVCLLSTSNISAQEAFDIDNHTINVVVNEDGTLNITETLSVTFNESRHGIYVNLPKKYSMDWNINGEKTNKSYFFPIKDIEVVSDHEFSIDDYTDFTRIILGSEDYYTHRQETYIYKYTVVTRDLDLSGLQMLYLNLITSGWDTVTKHCDFTIAFPKDFSDENIMIAYPGGMMTSLGSERGLTLSRQGNVLIGSYDRPIQADEALTIRVMLDNDYYTFPTFDRKAACLTAIGGIFTLTVFIIFLLKGRDNQVLITAQYHLPAGITSAEVGLVIDEEISDNDLVSLILDWGRRGIITINETGKDLYLHKINDLESDCRSYERIMFDKLFETGDEIKLSDKKYKFSNVLENARKALSEDYQQAKIKLLTTESIWLQYAFIAMGFVPATLFIGILIYQYCYNEVVIPVIFILAGVLIGLTLLACATFRKRYVYSKTKRTLYWLIVVIGYLLLFTALIVVCRLTKIKYYYAFYVLFMQVMILICTVCMRKRTEHGDEMLGRVLGLRQFILDADERKLQELTEENPYYFYDILPFAYALNLTSVWNEHFKNLQMKKCDWYDSDEIFLDNYHMIYSLNSQMETIKTTMSSIETSSGGSDFSSGSSDFSGGGGFGGSSGGSW